MLDFARKPAIEDRALDFCQRLQISSDQLALQIQFDLVYFSLRIKLQSQAFVLILQRGYLLPQRLADLRLETTRLARVLSELLINQSDLAHKRIFDETCHL